MVMSYCIPYRDREADLRAVLPSVLAAAAFGPPAEVVIVDYGSATPLGAVAGARVVRVERPWYHMAHARNLAFRAAAGDVLVVGHADYRLHEGYFAAVRGVLASTGAVWARPRTRNISAVACRRDELLAAGGFDERFEFYGPEDTDLRERLLRRGGRWTCYSNSYIHEIPTPPRAKLQGYRLALTKRQMHQAGLAVLLANRAAGALVANAGLAWGSEEGPCASS